jgi:soluble lytic murein transglycosylase-like protein
VATLAATTIASSAFAQSSGTPYSAIIESHAAANGVPTELVHRVIMRESRYNAGAMGRGGAIGLMQIKLATARGLGYTGSAAGLRDPETNLTYGIRYLAGAYRAANGHHGRAVGYYASGYYYVAKRQRMRAANAYADAAPQPGEPLSLIPASSQSKRRR